MGLGRDVKTKKSKGEMRDRIRGERDDKNSSEDNKELTWSKRTAGQKDEMSE